MKENANKFIKQKNSNIARSHNLRFMARAMVAYLIVAQLVTKRQIISSSLFLSQMQLFLNSLPIKTGYAERDCSQDCSHCTHANPSLMSPSQSGTIGAKGAAYKISGHKYGIGSVGSLRHLLNTAALIA